MNEHCRDLHRKFYMKVNMKRIIFKKCVSFGNNGYSHVTCKSTCKMDMILKI